MMLYVGLDAHLRQSTFCVLDQNGRGLQTKTVRGAWPKVVNQLKALSRPMSVCFEASIRSTRVRTTSRTRTCRQASGERCTILRHAA